MREGTSHLARCHSESASTRTISAEGSLSSRQIRTAPQRERFDTHDLRRGFAELKTNSHGATARAPRHARSPQRVRRAQHKFARRHSQSASTRTISVEGSPSSRQIRTAPQPERFDTHDLRRGFGELKTNSHGATARELRHARSPQRVRRAQDKFARRHSQSASTRTISAEGSPSSRQIRTAPQPERFDTHDLRRGFAERKTNSHGATARALRHARSPQRVHFRLATPANERNAAPATKFTDPVSKNAARATHHLHQRKTCCAHHEKRTAVSQNAALAMEFCGNTQIRRSARRHSESAVLKKGPFRAKLSHARQLFATTAMVLELRLSKRGSLTRQEDITAWRPCHQKTHLGLKNRVWHEASLKNTPRVAARTSQLLPLPAKAEMCERHHSETHAPPRTSISCETVASKTTFYSQGQQFEPTPRSTPGLNSYRKNPLV